jgi:hypothetical protein
MSKTRTTLACGLSILFFVAFPCITTSQAVNTEPQLTFSAKPTKRSFHQGEKVTFNFQLRNEDSKDVLVSPAFILGYDITLELKDSSGKSIPWCGVVTQWVTTGKKLVVLQAGKSLAVTRQISCDGQKQAGYSLLEPGKYTVIAGYSVPVASGQTVSDPKEKAVAKGPYITKSVEFTITARAGGTPLTP